MAKRFFVKIVTNPEVDLRKCIVGVACAVQAINDGHEVDVFFAADGVKMLHAEFIAEINKSGALPEGMLDGMLQTLTGGAKSIYCSTQSQAANGVTKDNADTKLIAGYNDWMTWSGPPGVIALSADSNIQLVY